MTSMIQTEPSGCVPFATRTTYLSAAGVQLGEVLRRADSIDGLETFFIRNGLPPDPELLGMGNFHQTDRDLWELAAEAAALACVTVSGIDSVILCSSQFPGETANHATGLRAVLHRCGLTPAVTAGVTLDRCTSFLAGLRMADALVAGGRSSRCLVVTADRFECDAQRLRSFALFSDGAAACLVAAEPAGEGPSYKIAGFGVATDPDGLSESARISPMMMRQASAALRVATGHDVSEHDLVFPTNVYLPVAMMAESQGGVATGAVYQKNIMRRGHVFAADPLVNLVDREAEPDPPKSGNRLLLGATVPGHRIALSLVRL